MIVSEDDRSGTISNHVSKDFTWVNLTAIKKANSYSALFNYFVGAV